MQDVHAGGVMTSPGMILARQRQAEQAAERYARYVISDPISIKGTFPRSPQTVSAQNNIGRRQVERHRARRLRAWEAEQEHREPEAGEFAITSEQVEIAVLIACNFYGEGGSAEDALTIAGTLGIGREVFAVAREMLGGDSDELPAMPDVKLYTELAEWLGEWPK